MLFNLGNKQPASLFVVVWDDGCYLSVGGLPTHTALGRVGIAATARGAGVEQAHTAHDLEEFARHCAAALGATSPYLVVAKVEAVVQPRLKRKHSDGREDRYVLMRHVEATEGVVIMYPSEYN